LNGGLVGKNLLCLASLKVALEEFMLEWKPKLITLILALVLVAMLVGLTHVVSLGGSDLSTLRWD
jgi:NAD/NADP transhydrogenase beta subunit